MSQDDLSYEARAHGAPKGMSSAWFSKVKLGKRPATIEFLRGVAGALGLDPDEFAEYRLAMARRQLDEREVGLEEATENLRQLEGLVGEGLPGPPAGDLARLLKGESPSPQDQRRSRSRGRAA